MFKEWAGEEENLWEAEKDSKRNMFPSLITKERVVILPLFQEVEKDENKTNKQTKQWICN